MAIDRNRESALWGWLKTGLNRVSLPKDVQRIENSVGLGTPDVEGCIAGGQFWVELKVAQEYVRAPEVTVHLTARQAYRALRRTAAGGSSFILVRVGSGSDMCHYLIWGAYAEEMVGRKISVERLRLLTITEPKARAEVILMACSRGIRQLPNQEHLG